MCARARRKNSRPPCVITESAFILLCPASCSVGSLHFSMEALSPLFFFPCYPALAFSLRAHFAPGILNENWWAPCLFDVVWTIRGRWQCERQDKTSPFNTYKGMARKWAVYIAIASPLNSRVFPPTVPYSLYLHARRTHALGLYNADKWVSLILLFFVFRGNAVAAGRPARG